MSKLGGTLDYKWRGRRNEMRWPEFPREWTDDLWPKPDKAV